MWIFIGIIVVILVLNHIFGWSAYLGNTENLKFLENMVQDNLLLAVLIYTVLTIVSCVVLALPGVTFAVIAGLVFGPVLGTICCSVATTLGAMVAFVVGRFFLQDSIKPMAMKNKYLKKWLFDETGSNEIFILKIIWEQRNQSCNHKNKNLVTSRLIKQPFLLFTLFLLHIMLLQKCTKPHNNYCQYKCNPYIKDPVLFVCKSGCSNRIHSRSWQHKNQRTYRICGEFNI